MPALQLGLIADTSVQLTKLVEIVEFAKLDVATALIAGHNTGFIEKPDMDVPKVDLWVVSVDMHKDYAFVIMDRLEEEPVPVIYDDIDTSGDLDTGLEERARSFVKKIEAYVAVNRDIEQSRRRAHKVWVLAASTGGPEAVVEFLKQLPDDLQDVAFIYAQHIDTPMLDNLKQVISRNTHWSVSDSSKAQCLHERSIVIVRPDQQIDIDEMQHVVPTGEPWQGAFSPSLDQVIAKIAKRFGADTGVIIFSGMGNDGAKGCRILAHEGGEVWAQSLESCTVDSMPKEAIATNCVSYIASPAELAKKFVSKSIRVFDFT